jgi:hypothetical protein
MVKYLIFPYQILNVLCRHGRRVLKFKAQGKSTVMGRQKYKKARKQNIQWSSNLLIHRPLFFRKQISAAQKRM